MTTALDAAPSRPYYADVRDDAATIRKVLDAAPNSIRALADEAGVSEKLLRMIRDGDRTLTPDVRDALRGALARWEADCREAAGALDEAAEPEAERGDDG